MIIPEINADHAALIDAQRNNAAGRPALSPSNQTVLCSPTPALQPLREFGLEDVVVSLQALSGAGKTIDSWPEMQDNVIPFISERRVNKSP